MSRNSRQREAEEKFYARSLKAKELGTRPVNLAKIVKKNEEKNKIQTNFRRSRRFSSTTTSKKKINRRSSVSSVSSKNSTTPRNRRGSTRSVYSGGSDGGKQGSIKKENGSSQTNTTDSDHQRDTQFGGIKESISNFIQPLKEQVHPDSLKNLLNDDIPGPKSVFSEVHVNSNYHNNRGKILKFVPVYDDSINLSGKGEELQDILAKKLVFQNKQKSAPLRTPFSIFEYDESILKVESLRDKKPIIQRLQRKISNYRPEIEKEKSDSNVHKETVAAWNGRTLARIVERRRALAKLQKEKMHRRALIKLHKEEALLIQSLTPEELEQYEEIDKSMHVREEDTQAIKHKYLKQRLRPTKVKRKIPHKFTGKRRRRHITNANQEGVKVTQEVIEKLLDEESMQRKKFLSKNPFDVPERCTDWLERALASTRTRGERSRQRPQSAKLENKSKETFSPKRPSTAKAVSGKRGIRFDEFLKKGSEAQSNIIQRKNRANKFFNKRSKEEIKAAKLKKIEDEVEKNYNEFLRTLYQAKSLELRTFVLFPRNVEAKYVRPTAY